jgi:lipoate-protein ligase A
MQLLDLTLPSPEENLALDEALLLQAEDGKGSEVLRFWSSHQLFVVMGVGGKTREEVDHARCEELGIPILRRCSGGGTVVQGPGCLNYSLILSIQPTGPLRSVSTTNRMIMERSAAAISALAGSEVCIRGHTDLAIEGKKISGNSQRRMRRTLLFHGTLLMDFNLDLISQLLPEPRLRPDYRGRRSHADFVRNLGLSETVVKKAMASAWSADALSSPPPLDRVKTLVENRYGRTDWNFGR